MAASQDLAQVIVNAKATTNTGLLTGKSRILTLIRALGAKGGCHRAREEQLQVYSAIEAESGQSTGQAETKTMVMRRARSMIGGWEVDRMIVRSEETRGIQETTRTLARVRIGTQRSSARHTLWNYGVHNQRRFCPTKLFRANTDCLILLRQYCNRNDHQ